MKKHTPRKTEDEMCLSVLRFMSVSEHYFNVLSLSDVNLHEGGRRRTHEKKRLKKMKNTRISFTLTKKKTRQRRILYIKKRVNGSV
jgi:hypothetical protein